MNKDGDAYFRKAVSILNQHNINFWLDQGTLLGAIRDKELIPWEWDIDFGVFEDKYKKEDIIKIFTSKGFIYEKIDNDSELSYAQFLYNDERKIDITFYKKNGNYGEVKFNAPTLKFKVKALNFVYTSIVQKNNSSDWFKKTSSYVINVAFRKLINRKLKDKIMIGLKNYLTLNPYNNIIIHKIPLSILLETIEINFLGVVVRVPKQAIRYLEITYGKDWRIPKKDWIWYKEKTEAIS